MMTVIIQPTSQLTMRRGRGLTQIVGPIERTLNEAAELRPRFDEYGALLEEVGMPSFGRNIRSPVLRQ